MQSGIRLCGSLGKIHLKSLLNSSESCIAVLINRRYLACTNSNTGIELYIDRHSLFHTGGRSIFSAYRMPQLCMDALLPSMPAETE